MLVFNAIRWKNFLSTGDAFTEVKLNEFQNVLIVGANGAGKSTILDALTFVLFGKAFRKINKPSLVNSVNQKNCLVEIEFETNNKQYKVIRGIKPGKFEIHCDGVCLNQDSTTKDYQEHLEKFILRMSYKSFTQVVILGSASFTPFMQLSPADRRGVIEDLLDIQIFSIMNSIAKQRLQTNKELVEKNRIEGLGKEEKKEFIERNLKSLRQNNEDQLNKLTLEADEHRFEIESLEREIESLVRGRRSYESDIQNEMITKPLKHLMEYQNVRAKITTKMEGSLKEIAFYCDNNDCPTCRQSIDSSFKTKAIDEQKEKVEEFQSAITKINVKIQECERRIKSAEKYQKKVDELNIKIQSHTHRLETHRKYITSIEDRMSKIHSADTILSSNEKELKDTTAEIDRLGSDKQKLLEDRSYIDTAINLLKDGGIKTKIIKQYLPVINKMINKYLLQMGFFVNFNIDENFEESIKSRYRDDFSYQSFSEGEKMKIDLAILFAWRAVAKMKNSVNTNLLVLDEIFDSSLDSNGTDEFLKIMWSLTGDSNIFVISHKQDQLIEKFQKVVRFEKQKNFSRML